MTKVSTRSRVASRIAATGFEDLDPAIAEALYDAERNKFQTIIGATSSHNKSVDAVRKGTSVSSVEPYVSVPLRTGGFAKLSMPFTTIDNDSQINLLYPPDQTYMTSLKMSVSQPLLRNGGIDINNASIRQAGLAMRQTDARTKITAIRILAEVENAYWNYYLAYENLKIQIQQYEYALEQVRVAKRLVEEGVRTKVEIVRAEAGVARRFDSVIRAETNRRIVERDFKRVMNDPALKIDSETIIMTETQPTPVSLTFDRDKVEKLAFDNRMELVDNEIQEMVNSITVDVKKNQLLPEVNLNFNYTFLSSKPKFTQTLDELFNETLSGYTVGLDLSYPLGNRVQEAGLQEAVLRKTQTLATRARLELAIRQDVNNAMDAIEQNWQRVLSNRKAAILSAEAYESDKIEFQYGNVTTIDVLVSLTSLTDARSAEIQSLTDFQRSLVDLAIASGTVLGRGGVIWEPNKSLSLKN